MNYVPSYANGSGCHGSAIEYMPRCDCNDATKSANSGKEGVSDCSDSLSSLDTRCRYCTGPVAPEDLVIGHPVTEHKTKD